MTHAAGSTREAAGQRPAPVRERILQAADQYFYAEGIRAVSADRLIAEAGVSKVTFYRHFPSKDDLVLAYLQGRSAVERAALERLRAETGGGCETFLAIARAIADLSCGPGFRGCPFINAAAEYADSAHPVRQAIEAHRLWFLGYLRERLAELGIDDRGTAAEQLYVLRDGAMVAGYLGPDPATRVDTLISAGRAVIDAARAS